MQTPPPLHPPETAGPFPPDLHDVRHLRLKAALIALWALVSFGGTYFARDLRFLLAGDWPLGHWIAAQGAVLAFIGIVVLYAWAMNRFERQDRASLQTKELASAPSRASDPGHG